MVEGFTFSEALSGFLLSGIAIAFVLLYTLYQKKFRLRSNLFLALVIIDLILVYSVYFLIHTGLVTKSDTVYLLRFVMESIPPPLIFLYAQTFVSEDLKIDSRIFFYPFACTLGFFSVVLIESLGFTESFNQDYHEAYAIIFRFTNSLQFLLYGYLLKRRYLRAKEDLIASGSRGKWIDLLSNLFFAHGGLLLFEAYTRWFQPEWEEITFYIITLFLISIILFWIFRFTLNPSIIHFTRKSVGEIPLKKYQRTRLENSEAKDLMAIMNTCMEINKPYLNYDLTINDFSETVGIPVHNISEITNGLMNQNFNDYVNNYRIEEFKRLAEAPANRNMKILAIAFDSGFNSKTSFNQSFKKFTGQTPSEYIQQLKK
jgi:AraC-like DNA-binding protein